MYPASELHMSHSIYSSMGVIEFIKTLSPLDDNTIKVLYFSKIYSSGRVLQFIKTCPVDDNIYRSFVLAPPLHNLSEVSKVPN